MNEDDVKKQKISELISAIREAKGLGTGNAYDGIDKSIEQLDRTLSVSNYGVYFFAGGKEVSFLGFEYTAANEEAVLDMLGIKELRNGRGLKLEYRLDGEGKEKFLASDRPENIFDAQVFVDGDYRSERPGRNRTLPEKIKDDMRRAAEEYTRENFGKSVREQIQAENEMNAVLTEIDAYCDDGIVPNDGRFILPKTPEYLRRIGSDETEITLPVSVVKKAMERHHLTKDEIKSAVCGLYDPVLAFDSDKSRTENKVDSRLILTDEFKDGNPIALAVNVNSTIRVSNGKKSLEVQNIRTIHDRTLTAKNGTDLIQKWTEDGLCRYVDDKKITGWSNVARVYFPIDELQSADNRIVRKSDIVNSWNDFFRNGEEIKIPNEVSEDMKNTVKASELINEVEGYTGHTKEMYEGLINYAYHRSAIQESGRESTDDFQMLFQNYVANRIPNEIARNGLIEKIKSFDGKTVIFDPDGINVGTAGLSDREGEKELKNLLSELKEAYPTLVNNLKNQNPIEQKEKEKEYQEWLSMTSPDEESNRKIDSGEIFGTYEPDEKQPHMQERDIAPGEGEEVDKGVEQIQANGGMDSAAMEADYEAEQNPRPDYLDEQGYPHWFDEEGETEVISDNEIERLKEQNPEEDKTAELSSWYDTVDWEDPIEAAEAMHNGTDEQIDYVITRQKQETAERKNESKATSYVLEKLKAAGIEVVADKDVFNNVLASKKILQRAKSSALSHEEIQSYFSFKKSEVERYNKLLDGWEQIKENPDRLLMVGHIPPVMKAIGIADEPVEIEIATISKALRPEPIFPDEKHGHNLTLEDVRAIPGLLADPVMVFKSRTRNDSYVFFTERKDSENRSIVIPLAVNKKVGRIIINKITSIYGRNNEEDYVYSNIINNNLVYMDRERAEEWEKKISPADRRTNQKQYLGQRSTKLTRLDNNILSKENLVNFLSSRQFMVSDGTTYGFAHGGKIYLNPETLNSNVAVHEYTHLWDNYTRATNPELWDKGMETFKKTSLWQEVRDDPNYADIADDDSLVLSECHARICGEVAQTVLERIASEDGEIARNTVIDWDKETWGYIAERMSTDVSAFKDAGAFMSMPMKDLMQGKNIRIEESQKKSMENENHVVNEKAADGTAVPATDQFDAVVRSRFENAAKKLVSFDMNSENYKEAFELLGRIEKLTGISAEQTSVRSENELAAESTENDNAAQAVESEPAKDTAAVAGEVSDVQNGSSSYQDYIAGNVVYGRTALPPFVSMTDDGRLKNCENFVVKGYDARSGEYFVDNGDEKLVLPRETFNAILKPIEHVSKDKGQEKNDAVYLSGNGIVFDNPEKGIKGTVIPEFSLMTQNGLQSYKDCVVSKFNEIDRTYTLRNNDSVISVSEECFKEITAPERFENAFDENTPVYKKMLKTQYEDFFKARSNTACNFRHNLSVFCRKEANSPCDALKVAKGIIQKMPPAEQQKTKELLKKVARKGESLNELIVRTYHEAVKEVPLNEEYIKQYQPENKIARPFYDTVSGYGQKVDNDSQLLRTDGDYNLKIGDSLKNIDIRSENVFGYGKENVHFSEMKVISASKEGNTITLMDKDKSFIELPRDTVLKAYKEQRLKEMKHSSSQNRRDSIGISY